jgi:hypothetical protein
MIDIEGPLGYCSSALLAYRGSHIGERALLDINLIWFGYFARLSQWGRGGYFNCSNDFYLPSLRLEKGVEVSTLCMRQGNFCAIAIQNNYGFSLSISWQ